MQVELFSRTAIAFTDWRTIQKRITQGIDLLLNEVLDLKKKKLNERSRGSNARSSCSSEKLQDKAYNQDRTSELGIWGRKYSNVKDVTRENVRNVKTLSGLSRRDLENLPRPQRCQPATFRPSLGTLRNRLISRELIEKIGSPIITPGIIIIVQFIFGLIFK